MTRIQRTLASVAGLGTPAALLVAVPRGEAVGLLLLAVPVAVVMVLVGAVRLLDLKRRRRDDAVQLESQIAEALPRDATLGRLPPTPEAHVPLWSGSPAPLILRGEVPRPELRDAARLSPGVRVEDRA